MLIQNVRGDFVSCLSMARARRGDTKGAVCHIEFLWIIWNIHIPMDYINWIMLPETTFLTFILRNIRKLN